MAITRINHKSVGRGRWSLQSIKNYCTKKGIQLQAITHRTKSVGGTYFDENIDIHTGRIIKSSHVDHVRHDGLY